MQGGKALAAGTFVAAAVIGIVLSQARTQSPEDKKGKPAEPEAKKAGRHKVEARPFHVELTAKGILEPGAAAEIAFRSQQAAPAGPLVIAKVVAHGSAVKKGDVLIAFQTEKLDQQLRDLAIDLKAQEASLKLSEADLPLAQKSAPEELAAARRDKKQADEDLKYFLEVDRAEQTKQADFALKQAQFSLDFAKEELRQLEKMYKSNDLTEETEKIILKRQRHFLEIAQVGFRRAELLRDLTLKVTIPRREAALQQQATKQALTLEKAEQTLTLGLQQKQLALAKLRHDRDKTRERLKTLEKDRANLDLHAPVDGIAYYGKFAAGAWTGGGPGKLAVNSTVLPEDVFMTIVQPRPVQMRWLVDEKDAALVKAGLVGSARFAYRPELKAPARVVRIAAAPSAPGQFEVVIAVELTDGHDGIAAGLACTARFTPYAKPNAVAVPAAAVFEEGEKNVVFVAMGSAKHETREVTVGRTFGNRTEILEGLRAGDEILLERPEGKEGAKS